MEKKIIRLQKFPKYQNYFYISFIQERRMQIILVYYILVIINTNFTLPNFSTSSLINCNTYPLKKIVSNDKFFLKIQSTINYLEIMNSTSYTDTNQLDSILDASIGISSYRIPFTIITVYYHKVLDAFFHYESLAIVNEKAFVIINTTSITKQKYLIYNSSISQTPLEIQLTNSTVYILSDNGKLYRYPRSTYNPRIISLSTWITPTNLRMSTCQKQNGSQYVVLWDQTTQVLILLCNTAGCVQVRKITDKASTTFTTDDIIFSSDCTLILIEQDTLNNIMVFDVLNNNYYSIMNPPTQKVYRLQFYQSTQNYIMVYYQNNTMTFYALNGTQPAKYQGQINFTYPLNALSYFSILQQKLYVQYSYSAYVRQIIAVANNSTPISIVMDNVTISNITSSQLTSLPTNETVNSTNSTSSINSTGINTTNRQGVNLTMTFNSNSSQTNDSTSTLNTTNNTNTSILGNSSGKVYNSMAEQIVIVQVVGNIQGPIIHTAQTAIIMMQVLPITVFFAAFLNYWTVCSLYALIRASKPYFLTQLLDSIYNAINTSVFQAFNIDISVSQSLYDQFQTTYITNYGVSSIFIANSFEAIVSFSISSLILFITFIIYKSLSNHNWLKHKLNFAYKVINIGQMSGLFTGFVMTLNVLIHFFNSASSNDKVNNMFNVTTVGLSVIFAFMILSFKNTAKPKQSIVVQNKLQQQAILLRQLAYCTFSQVFLAFVILLENVPFTLIFGFPLFILGFLQASKSKQFRCNKMILSLHLILFHTSFTCMVLSQSNQIIFNTFGLLCVIFLFIGAIHQILNLIFDIFFSIYESCKSRKVQNLKQVDIKQKLKDLTKKQIIFFPKIKQNPIMSKKTKKFDENKNKPKLLYPSAIYTAKMNVKRRGLMLQKKKLNKLMIESTKSPINEESSSQESQIDFNQEIVKRHKQNNQNFLKSIKNPMICSGAQGRVVILKPNGIVQRTQRLSSIKGSSQLIQTHLHKAYKKSNFINNDPSQ